MAFQRSQEGPMEFEYQHRPFFSYNAFDAPKDQDVVMTEPNDLAHKPPTTSNQEYLPALDEVSNHLDGINLNDQPAKEPELIHREIQTDDLPPFHDLLSSPPHTPPTTTADLPVISQQEHTHPSQHLHQHIYPSLHNPHTSRENFIHAASSLIRMGCDLAWFTMAVFVCVQFSLALKKDVHLKLESFESDRLDEFLNCQMEYANNRCDPSTRVPAMDELCRQWQQCLYRPMWIGTTRAVAETLADMINGFVDKISFRTMLFIFITLVITLWSRTYSGGQSRSSDLGGAYPMHPKAPEERKQIAWSD